MLGQHGTLHFTVCIEESERVFSHFGSWCLFIFGFQFVVSFFSLLSCLSVSFCPNLGKIKKEREQASHAFIIIIIIPERGRHGDGGLEQLVLYFWSSGNIGEILPSCEPVSFIPTLGLLVFTTYDTKPLFLFSPADPHPCASQGPGYHSSRPSSILIKHTARTLRDGEESEGKGGIFHPRGSGTAGMKGGVKGVSEVRGEGGTLL